MDQQEFPAAECPQEASETFPTKQTRDDLGQ